MKKEQVPQDAGSTYGGHRKLLYATDEVGAYTGVPSLGWSVETQATRDAIEEIERLCAQAWQRARTGQSSPLEYHMYRCRMDLPLLAQASGMFQWRVRRHLSRPDVFARLGPNVMRRYAEALGMSEDALRRLPESAA